MSIATAIISAQAKVAAAYSKCNDKGATMPATQDLAHLDDCIDSIPTGSAPNLQTLNVTPTTSAQQITPTSPVDGYDEVNVSAVTAAIDANIQAGNIKKDVSILGVTGTYEGSGGGAGDFIYKIKAGLQTTISASEGALLANLLGAENKCHCLFYGAGVVSADLSAVTSINGANAASEMFFGSQLESVDFSGLVSVAGNAAFSSIFARTELKVLSLPELTTCSHLDTCCQNCTSLETINIPKLSNKSSSSNQAFYGCTSLKEANIHPNIVADSRGNYNIFGTFTSPSTFTKLRLSADATNNVYITKLTYLDSDSILDVLNHLSTEASGKTCAFGDLTVSSNDPNYAAISAKVTALTNWTITGLTL